MLALLTLARAALLSCACDSDWLNLRAYCGFEFGMGARVSTLRAEDIDEAMDVARPDIIWLTLGVVLPFSDPLGVQRGVSS
jgi:hypothetical protein